MQTGEFIGSWLQPLMNMGLSCGVTTTNTANCNETLHHTFWRRKRSFLSKPQNSQISFSKSTPPWDEARRARKLRSVGSLCCAFLWPSTTRREGERQGFWELCNRKRREKRKRMLRGQELTQCHCSTAINHALITLLWKVAGSWWVRWLFARWQGDVIPSQNTDGLK